jgi:hypothetical protein
LIGYEDNLVVGLFDYVGEFGKRVIVHMGEQGLTFVDKTVDLAAQQLVDSVRSV